MFVYLVKTPALRETEYIGCVRQKLKKKNEHRFSLPRSILLGGGGGRGHIDPAGGLMESMQCHDFRTSSPKSERAVACVSMLTWRRKLWVGGLVGLEPLRLAVGGLVLGSILKQLLQACTNQGARTWL